eukprot:295223-Hanusia_phi.AAC.2
MDIPAGQANDPSIKATLKVDADSLSKAFTCHLLRPTQSICCMIEGNFEMLVWYVEIGKDSVTLDVCIYRISKDGCKVMNGLNHDRFHAPAVQLEMGCGTSKNGLKIPVINLKQQDFGLRKIGRGKNALMGSQFGSEQCERQLIVSLHALVNGSTSLVRTAESLRGYSTHAANALCHLVNSTTAVKRN